MNPNNIKYIFVINFHKCLLYRLFGKKYKEKRNINKIERK